MRSLILLSLLALGCGSRVGDEDVPLDAAVGDTQTTATDTTTTTDTTPPPPCDAPAEVFAKSCALTACHAPADAPSSGGLDLGSPGIYARLRDKPARGGVGLLINVSDPERSVLYTKTASPAPFGARMPLGGVQLASERRGCLLEWIESGS